ncbi:Exodeoxyribonuclease I [compost metagenome]
MPLKLVQVNRCPVLAPLKVLREEDCQRLGVDMSACQRQAQLLEQRQAVWKGKLPAIFADNGFTASDDPEQRLYDGFIGDRDRGLCVQVRESDPLRLAERHGLFGDERLEELLFRYRARNFPQTLSAADHQRWEEFCRLRLSDSRAGAPNTLAEFDSALAALLAGADTRQQALLAEWQAHAQQLRQRYGLA